MKRKKLSIAILANMLMNVGYLPMRARPGDGGQLSNLRVIDPVLTELAIGYTNEELVGIQLLPAVPVVKEGGQIPRFSAESFLDYETKRAIRADSNVMTPDSRDYLKFVLDEYDIARPIDYREESEDMLNAEKVAQRITQDIIMMTHERLTATLAQDASQYASSNKISLTGSGTATSPWSDGTNSDPVANITAGKEAVRSRIGRYPNTITFDAQSWQPVPLPPQGAGADSHERAQNRDQGTGRHAAGNPQHRHRKRHPQGHQGREPGQRLD